MRTIIGIIFGVLMLAGTSKAMKYMDDDEGSLTNIGANSDAVKGLKENDRLVNARGVPHTYICKPRRPGYEGCVKRTSRTEGDVSEEAMNEGGSGDEEVLNDILDVLDSHKKDAAPGESGSLLAIPVSR